MSRSRLLALVGSLGVVLWLFSGVSPFWLDASMIGDQGEVSAAATPSAALLWLVASALYVWVGTRRPPVPESPPVPAGLLRRFAAFCLDFSVCYVIAGVPMVLLALGIEALARGSFTWEAELAESPRNLGAACGMVVIPVLLLALFFSWPVANHRFSPGMLASGYYVYSPKELSLGRSFLRTLMGFLSLASIALSGPMALAREDRRMWHDLAFGTYPRRTAKE